ncbi:MAG: cupin domain-containing protein [Candidatus Bathyarchaeota archaeon]|nr:cupin domain-containing protein [Candidatus Bathyarchaeota archaeon]
MVDGFVSMRLGAGVDEVAPDGSEIRLLPCVNGGSMVHCTLPVGRVSLAVRHRTVEEIWYVLRGRGEVWRRMGEVEEVVPVEPGMSLVVPVGTCFQFRTTGVEPLRLIIVTMPPWPGEDEAERVPGYWLGVNSGQ